MTLLDLTNFPKPSFGHPMFVSSGENLCVIDRFSMYSHKGKKIQEINFSKMEWVPREKIKEEYAFFYSQLNYDVVILPLESWADLYTLQEI